jgi:hypothetical protein
VVIAEHVVWLPPDDAPLAPGSESRIAAQKDGAIR